MGLARRLHRRESLLLPSSDLFCNTHDGISASTLLSSTCKGLWPTFIYYCLKLAIPTSVLKLPFICEVLRYSLKFKRHGASPPFSHLSSISFIISFWVVMTWISVSNYPCLLPCKMAFYPHPMPYDLHCLQQLGYISLIDFHVCHTTHLSQYNVSGNARSEQMLSLHVSTSSV